MFKQIFLILSFASLYLLFTSAPAQVLPYQNYKQPADLSSHLKGNRFTNIEVVQSPQLQYPQDIDIDTDTGDIYTGNSRGGIFKISPTNQIENILQGKGPILKIEYDRANNHLYFIDLGSGICRADLKTKEITTLVSVKGYGALNSFDIAKDGTIYFSEISSRFAPSSFVLAILSARPDGNVYQYDPQTNQTAKIISNLYCPNGIEVSPDGKSLYISEMGRYRVIRYNLETLSKESVIQDLEASPDNLRFNKDGDLWIGLPVFRDGFQNILMQSTWLRNTLSKLSPSLLNSLARSTYTGALKINTKGEVLDYIKEGTSVYSYLSTAMEHNGKLYLASFKFPAIARVPLRAPEKTSSRQQGQQL